MSVENVIIKATAKNPKNRYSDSRAMHDDLLTVLDDDRLLLNQEVVLSFVLRLFRQHFLP